LAYARKPTLPGRENEEKDEEVEEGEEEEEGSAWTLGPKRRTEGVAWKEEKEGGAASPPLSTLSSPLSGSSPVGGSDFFVFLNFFILLQFGACREY
jgi:hypothetical protein